MLKLKWHALFSESEFFHAIAFNLRTGSTPSMHSHDFYECFLPLDGEGFQVTPEGEEALVCNQLYFVRPEHRHMLREKDNLLLLNLAFETSVFEQALNLSEFPDNCWAEDAPIQAMSLTANQVGRLQEAVQAVAVDRNRRNASWLVLTIARIITRSTHPAHHRGPAPEWMVNGLGKAAEPHLLREGMPGLYRAMGRSAEHVSRCFKTYFGLTPTEWLNRERIKRAQLLLATSGISILEIAMECGFESQSYFHKQFREQVGKSPLQYRKQLYRVQP